MIQDSPQHAQSQSEEHTLRQYSYPAVTYTIAIILLSILLILVAAMTEIGRRTSLGQYALFLLHVAIIAGYIMSNRKTKRLYLAGEVEISRVWLVVVGGFALSLLASFGVCAGTIGLLEYIRP